MALGKIMYGPCRNNATGFYDFCCVHSAISGEQQLVYALGFCRENKLKGKTPCEHKTELDAIKCFRSWEIVALEDKRITQEEVLPIFDLEK